MRLFRYYYSCECNLSEDRSCNVSRTALFTIHPSGTWSDDEWYIDQEDRIFIENTGYRFFNVEQTIEGILVGGNLDTFSLLFGTEYMPSLKDKIVLIEDDCLTVKEGFDRHLTSLIQQPDFSEVRTLVIGRFQNESKIDDKTLDSIIQSKVLLKTRRKVYE